MARDAYIPLHVAAKTLIEACLENCAKRILEEGTEEQRVALALYQTIRGAKEIGIIDNVEDVG